MTTYENNDGRGTVADQDPGAGGLRVLVVDDSAVTRAMVKRSIAIGGAPVDTLKEAGDGEQALELLRSERFDVCFLDLNMPRLGGCEVAAAVRADASISTRIVIVSSESMAGKIEQLQQSGVTGYIKKPFTPEQICNVLHGVLAEAA